MMIDDYVQMSSMLPYTTEFAPSSSRFPAAFLALTSLPSYTMLQVSHKLKYGIPSDRSVFK